MKVWVGYRYYMYEGCTEPEKVFDTEEKAINWCKDDPEFKEIKKLEIE